MIFFNLSKVNKILFSIFIFINFQSTIFAQQVTSTLVRDSLNDIKTISKGDAAAQYLFQWFYAFNDFLKDPVKLVFCSRGDNKINVIIMSRNQDRDPQRAQTSISDVFQLILIANKQLQKQCGVSINESNVIIAYDIVDSNFKIFESMRFDDGKYIDK